MIKKGITALITGGWWEKFCGHYPNLTLRALASLSKARVEVSDPTVMNRYFDMLQEVLTGNDLIDRPFQIFNMDESGMPLAPKSVKCVFRKGDPNPVAPSSGEKHKLLLSHVLVPLVPACHQWSSWTERRYHQVLQKEKCPEQHMASQKMDGLTKNYMMDGLPSTFLSMSH